VASPKGYNFAVFYYFSASKIWPVMRGGLWWEELYNMGKMYVLITSF